MKNNSCTPINPKKYSCYGLKKNHTRNLITKKILAARKLLCPLITFLMVPSLNRFVLKGHSHLAFFMMTNMITFAKGKVKLF